MRQALYTYREHGVKRTSPYLTESTVWLEKQTGKALITLQSKELPDTVNPGKRASPERGVRVGFLESKT